MATLAEARAIISADDSKFQQVTRRVTGGVSRLARSGASIGKGIGAGSATAVRGVANIGVAALKTTALIGSLALAMGGMKLGTEAISTITSYGTELSKVEALTGAAGASFEALADKARGLGATTQFSAAQAAGGMAFLAQAGFEANAILESSGAFLNLAAAGGLELAETMDLASNVMSGFSLEATEASRVSDVLAKAAASSNTNVSQLGEAFAKLGPVAKTLGIDIEQAAAAIGQLGNVGIQGADAGTALRNIFLRLSAGGAEVEKGVAAIGLTLDDLSPSANTVSEIFDKLGVAIKESGISADGAVAAYSQIFGVRATAAGASLDRLSGSVSDLERELRNSEGTAESLAKTMLNNLGGDLKATRSAFEEVILVAGDEGLTGAMRSSAQQTTEFFRELGKSDGFRAGVRDTLALASTLRTNLVTALGEARDRVEDLYSTLSLNGVFDKFADASQKVVGSLDGIRDFTMKVQVRGLDVLATVSPVLLDAFNGAWDLFAPIATRSLNVVGKVADATLGETFRGFAESLDVDLGDLFDSFARLSDTLADKIVPAIGELLSKLGISVEMVDSLSPAFRAAGSGIGSLITSTAEVVTNFTNIANEALKTGRFGELAALAFTASFERATNDVSKQMVSLGLRIEGSIRAGFLLGQAQLFSLVQSTFNELSSNLTGVLVGSINTFKSSIFGIGNILDTELKPAGDLGPQLSETANRVFDSVKNGVGLIVSGINDISKSTAGFLLLDMVNAFAEIAATGPALVLAGFEPVLKEIGDSKFGSLLGLDDFEAKGFDKIRDELGATISGLVGGNAIEEEALENYTKGIDKMGEGLVSMGEGAGIVAAKFVDEAKGVIADTDARVDKILSQKNPIFNEDESRESFSSLLSELQATVDDEKFSREVAESITRLDATFADSLKRAEDEMFQSDIDLTIDRLDKEVGAAFDRAESEIHKGAVTFRDTLTGEAEITTSEAAGLRRDNTESLESNTKSVTANTSVVKAAINPLREVGVAASRAAKEQQELANSASGAKENLDGIQAYQFDVESRQKEEDSPGKSRLLGADEPSRIKKSERDFTGIDDVKFERLDNPGFRLLDNADFSGLRELNELNQNGPRDFGVGVNPSNREFGEAVNPSERASALAFEKLKADAEKTSLGLNQVVRDVSSGPVEVPGASAEKSVGIAQQQIACLRQIKAELKTLNSTSKRTESILDGRLPEKTI